MMNRIATNGWVWFCLVLAACSAPEAAAPVSPAATHDLPLQTLGGEQTNLSEYAGDVIVVNFWATWCGPCRQEMPELEGFYQAHQDDDFILLAVNAGESANRAQDFIDEGGYTFPVMLDQNGAVADYFGGLRGMPVTFVIDRQGEIAYQHFGPLDRSVLDAEVLPLLE